MQDERVLTIHLDQTGQVVLLDLWVDVRVPRIVEYPEEAVQPHVDAGGLDQRGVERVERQGAGLDLREQVTVGQQHGGNSMRPPPGTDFRPLIEPLQTATIGQSTPAR